MEIRDVILRNSEVNFPEEREETALCLSLCYFLVIYGVAVSK